MSGFATIARGAGGSGGSGEETNAAAITTFGETLVGELSPSSQAAFVYGISSVNFVTSSQGSGSSVVAVTGSAVLNSGTSTSGSATVQLRRGLKYRAGQGSLARFTAIFGTPQSGSYQLAGFGNRESGFYFGYKELDFGIIHRSHGDSEIRKLVISSGVANGTAVTITLNGDARTFTINGGSSINQTSWEISQQDFTTFGGGWRAEAYDGTIYFIAQKPEAKSGSYSATGAGLVATFSQVVAGSVWTENFISQSQWNIDAMDGSGPSRFNIDVTKGNVYQVGFQYLGYGNTKFAIEDSETGKLQPCHMIKQANARTLPVLKDPHVTVRWSAENQGSNTSTFLTGTCGAIFTEGNVAKNIGPSFSVSATNSDIDTSEEPIVSVRSNRIFNDRTSYSEIEFLSLTATSVTTGAHFVTIRIYKNLRLSGPSNFQNVSSTQSHASYDTSATGFTLNNSQLISTYVLGSGQTISINLSGDGYYLSSGEVLTITGQASTNNIDASVALTWVEDT